MSLLPATAMSHVLTVLEDEDLFSLVTKIMNKYLPFFIIDTYHSVEIVPFVFKKIKASAAKDKCYDLIGRLWGCRSRIELKGKFVSYIPTPSIGQISRCKDLSAVLDLIAEVIPVKCQMTDDKVKVTQINN